MVKRLGKILAWFTVGLLSLVAAALVGAIILLQTQWAHGLIGQKVVEAVDQALDAKLSFSRLGGSILGSVELTDVRLEKGGRVIVSAGFLRARYSLFDLLKPRIEVAQVSGRDVLVDLPGVMTLGGGGDDSGGGVDLWLRRVSLENAALDGGEVMGPCRRVESIDAVCGLKLHADAPLELDAEITGARCLIDGLPGPVDLTAKGRLVGDELNLGALKAALGRAVVSGRGTLGWRDDVRWQADLRVEGLQGSGLAWPEWLPAQAGSLSLKADGTLADTGLEARWPEQEMKLDAHVSWVEGLLSVRGFGFTAPWGELRADGAWRPAKGPQGIENLTLEVSKLCVPPFLASQAPAFLAGLQVGGKVSVNQKGGGLSMELELGQCCVTQGLDLSGLTAMCRLDGRDVAVDSLDANLGWGFVKAKGSLGTERLDLTVNIDAGDLARVAAMAKSAGLVGEFKLAGQAVLEVTLRGAWSNPDVELRAEVNNLEADNLSARHLDLSGKVASPLDRPSGQIHLEAMDLTSGEVSLHVAELTYGVSAKGAALKFRLEGGELAASGVLSSGQRNLAPEKLTLDRLILDLPEYGLWTQDGTAEIMRSRGVFGVKGLDLACEGQALTLDGRIDMAGPVDVVLTVQNLALWPFVPMLEDYPDRGRLDGKASLSGTLGQPKAMVSGVFHSLNVPQAPKAKLAFTGSYQEEMMHLDGKLSLDERPVMNLRADLGLKISLRPPIIDQTEKGIEATLTAEDMPLGIFDPYLPWVYDLKGSLSMRASCRGPWQDPDMRGSLTMRGGSFGLPQTDQTISGIDVDLSLADHRVIISRFRLDTGKDGLPLELSGGMDLPIGQEGAFDLHLKGRDIIVSLGDLGWVRSGVDLSLTGPLEHASLTGSLTPYKAMVRYQNMPPPEMNDVVIMKPGMEPPPIGKEQTELKPTGWLGSLTIDAAVDLSGGLRVEFDEGYITAGGKLVLSKKPDDFIYYSGTIKIRSGLILIYGRRIHVNRGLVDFGGKKSVNPDLDLEAGINMGNISVLATISGSAGNPQVALSSQPPMSQADLLSTIVFGRPAGELSGDQQQYLSAQALALLGFRGTMALQKVFGPQFTPDVITVHDSAQYGPSLEAGKYISDNLYLRYRKNLGSEGGQNVGLEYQFNRYWSVDSQVGDSRDTGVDVFYSVDWGRP